VHRIGWFGFGYYYDSVKSCMTMKLDTGDVRGRLGGMVWRLWKVLNFPRKVYSLWPTGNNYLILKKIIAVHCTNLPN